jgi:GNAT superfamily N-acetyltransferase
MSVSYSIRRASQIDSPTLAEVHGESIRTLGGQHYPERIVRDWVSPCVPGRYLDRMDAGEVYFLAEAEEGVRLVLGFSSYRLEAGKHRTAVYVAGRCARSGVGAALFRTVDDLARVRGAAEVHVSSSLGAVGFYRAMGFEELGRGTHVMRSGGEMACVFMRKALPGRPQFATKQ